MMARSAIAMRAKMTTAFMVKLIRSGYQEGVRMMILESGVRGFVRKVMEQKSGGIRINNLKSVGAQAR